MNVSKYLIVSVMLALCLLCIAGCTTLSEDVNSRTYSEDEIHHFVVNPNGTHSTVEWVDYHDNGGSGSVYFVIYKVRIDDDNTTCYISRAYQSGGISCLKDMP